MFFPTFVVNINYYKQQKLGENCGEMWNSLEIKTSDLPRMVIMDYPGLLWTIKDKHGLSQTILDYPRLKFYISITHLQIYGQTLIGTC